VQGTGTGNQSQLKVNKRSGEKNAILFNLKQTPDLIYCPTASDKAGLGRAGDGQKLVKPRPPLEEAS